MSNKNNAELLNVHDTLIAALKVELDQFNEYLVLDEVHFQNETNVQENLKSKIEMKIQINTDRSIKGDEKNIAYYTTLITTELQKQSSHITRIEVHLSDENGKKEALRDKRCLMEARLEGLQPIAVSSTADTVQQAITDAVNKLKVKIDHILDRSVSKR